MEGNRVRDLRLVRLEQRAKLGKDKKVRRIAAKLAAISNHLGESFEESKKLASEGATNVSHDIYRAKQYVQQALENITKKN